MPLSNQTGLTYRGKAADTWAVGVTLYCMVMGSFPFIGETLQDTYDKVCRFLFLRSSAQLHQWFSIMVCLLSVLMGVFFDPDC